MKKTQVGLETGEHHEILNFYMGKNTQERQDFIIENLKVEIETPLDGDKKLAEV
jgi:topoisomerase IV subunit B